MGAGSFTAGTYPAGTDPPQATALGPLRATPAALRYDGATRDFLLDASQGTPYQYASVHPVDQLVALRLQVKQGSVRSVPALGSRFHLIPLDDRAAASAQNEVDRLLDDLVASRSIAILKVEVQVRLFVTGSLVVQVDYANLLLGSSRVASNAPQLLSSTVTP